MNKTITRRSPLARAAALALALGAAPLAQAVTVTWYVSGTIDAANGGNPLDARLAAAFPNGTAFVGSFSFDTASPAISLIPGTRTDFVTDGAHGGATVLQFAGGSYSSSSSRLLTQYSFNGEDLTLNANSTPAGAAVPTLDLVGLDLLTMGHYGPPNADSADKYPWYTPGHMPSALPDLAQLPAGTVPLMNLFFFDPAAGQYAYRIGLIDGLSSTPFSLPAVPEPGSCALFGAGLGLLALLQRRRFTPA